MIGRGMQVVGCLIERLIGEIQPARVDDGVFPRRLPDIVALNSIAGSLPDRAG
jgi:hypothetical protein